MSVCKDVSNDSVTAMADGPVRYGTIGETGASCNKINSRHYCTSVDCPFETDVVPNDR